MRILFTCLVCFTQFLVFSQSNPNPFELTHRLKTIVLSHKNDSLKANEHYNPFDIPNKKAIKKKSINTIVNVPAKRNWTFTSVNVKPEIFFGLFIGLFCLLAFVSINSRNIYLKIIYSLKNINTLKFFKREAGNFFISPIILLYLFWLINIGCFIFLLSHYFKDLDLNTGSPYSIWFFIKFVTIILILKHILWYSTGQLFSFKKEMDIIHFGIILINILLGLILFPINLFLVYIPIGFIKIIATIGIIAIVAMYLYRAFIALLVSNKFIQGNLFHFLLYFCTVEIAPFVIILKYLLVKSSI